MTSCAVTALHVCYQVLVTIGLKWVPLFGYRCLSIIWCMYLGALFLHQGEWDRSVTNWLATTPHVALIACQCSRSGLSSLQHFTRQHQHLLPAPFAQKWATGQRDQRSWRGRLEEEWEKPSNQLVIKMVLAGNQIKYWTKPAGGAVFWVVLNQV